MGKDVELHVEMGIAIRGMGWGVCVRVPVSMCVYACACVCACVRMLVRVCARARARWVHACEYGHGCEGRMVRLRLRLLLQLRLWLQLQLGVRYGGGRCGGWASLQVSVYNEPLIHHPACALGPGLLRRGWGWEGWNRIPFDRVRLDR